MDENKTYDFKGTVTISTAEYRDLIQERATYKCEAENIRDYYYRALSEVKAKDIEIEKLKAELNRLNILIDVRLESIRSAVGVEEASDA